MNSNNDTGFLPTKSSKNRWDPLLESKSRKFVVQTIPPLSLRQSVRQTINVSPNQKPWKPYGIYHPPMVYETPPSKQPDPPVKITVKSSKNSPPAWYPPGVAKVNTSKSLNKENTQEKSRDVTNKSESNAEPKQPSKSTVKSVNPWHPSGNRHYKPVPYFDAPSLRWTLPQVKESMSNFMPKPKNSITNSKQS